MNHASRRLSWNSTCAGFWLNRTASDRSPLSEEHRAPSSGRMQPLLSEANAPWIFTACTPSLLKKLQMPFRSSSKDGVKFWRQKCSRYSAAGFHFAAGDMSVDFTPVCKCPPFATADSCFLIPYCAQDRAWNACRRRVQELRR